MFADRKILSLFVCLLFPTLASALICTGSWYDVFRFWVNDYDYGLFSNLIWNFANGNGWTASLYAGQSREFFLADHMALTIPLLAPFFKLFPSPYMLSVIHAISCSSVFFLIPIFVKQVWKEAGRTDYYYSALFLSLTIFVSKAFTGAWLFQSHMTTIAMPFLLLALLALHTKKPCLMLLCSLLVLLSQERGAVAVAGIGMYAFLVTHDRRLGFLLAAAATAYFFAVVKIVIPWAASSDSYLYDNAIAPLYRFSHKLAFTFKFLLQWAFLPLAGQRAMLALLCSMPVLGLNLVSNRNDMLDFHHHYLDLPSMFFLVAAIHGLLWLTGKKWCIRVPGFVLALAASLFLYFSGNETWTQLPGWNALFMKTESNIVRTNDEIQKFMNITEDIDVYANSGIGPRLTLREKRYPISPQQAAMPLRNSVVIIAPYLSLYPYGKDPDVLLMPLMNNKDLDLIYKSDVLQVFISKDIEPSKILEH